MYIPIGVLLIVFAIGCIVYDQRTGKLKRELAQEKYQRELDKDPLYSSTDVS